MRIPARPAVNTNPNADRFTSRARVCCDAIATASLVEHVVQKLAGPRRTAQIEIDRAFVGLDVDREAQEPTALPFGLYDAGNQGQRIGAPFEMQAIPVWTIFKAAHAPP